MRTRAVAIPFKQALRESERFREEYWTRNLARSRPRLQRRATAVRQLLRILPGKRVLELGAGSGFWSDCLDEAFEGENPITAVVFNADLAAACARRASGGVRVVLDDDDLALAAGSYDYIVASNVIDPERYHDVFEYVFQLLKPGGKFVVFEANHWTPHVLVRDLFSPLMRLLRRAQMHCGMQSPMAISAARRVGFSAFELFRQDLVIRRMPGWLLGVMQEYGHLLEVAPALRWMCGTLCLIGTKPADRPEVPTCCLAKHRQLFGSVSFVVPCHNEESNLTPLVSSLTDLYGPYIREIILINDNSTDATGSVARQIATEHRHVKVIDRKPPAGVGRALRAGCAAATGSLIFMLDCDFAAIAPEFRRLFDAIAAGHHGAVGSRFSRESMLVEYPFSKLLCNRILHWLLRIVLIPGARDLSNNLKLYRAEVLKEFEIEEAHFAANLEIGVKPLLAGFDICEVPISWINRTADMGKSSFNLLRVGPAYAALLFRLITRTYLQRQLSTRPAGGAS